MNRLIAALMALYSQRVLSLAIPVEVGVFSGPSACGSAELNPQPNQSYCIHVRAGDGVQQHSPHTSLCTVTLCMASLKVLQCAPGNEGHHTDLISSDYRV